MFFYYNKTNISCPHEKSVHQDEIYTKHIYIRHLHKPKITEPSEQFYIVVDKTQIN